MTVITRMQQKRGTAAQWVSNDPVLAPGEIGYETDTNKMKLGDGVTAYSGLPYFGGGGGGGGVGGTTAITITGPGHGQLDWFETVAAPGVTIGDRVLLQLAPEDNAEENGPEMLDPVTLTATCTANNTIDVLACFETYTRGPINLIYGVI